MGDRSHSTYVRTANRRWTPVFAAEEADVDPVALAAERGDVVQVWFDDDAGVVLRVTGAGGFAGELTFPLFEDGGAGVQDARFIDALVGRGLLTATAARTLKSRLKDPTDKRDAWILGHGVEKAFGFPSSTPEPVAAAAAKTAPKNAAPRQAASVRDEDDGAAPLPRRYRLPEEARPTLDLHVFYWREVWSMNSFTLYNCYKKHLPAADRRWVDELANAVAMGNTAEIPLRVERILVETWQAEDWAAFIRSPKVDDAGADDDTARRWREMTGRGERLH